MAAVAENTTCSAQTRWHRGHILGHPRECCSLMQDSIKLHAVDGVQLSKRQAAAGAMRCLPGLECRCATTALFIPSMHMLDRSVQLRAFRVAGTACKHVGAVDHSECTRPAAAAWHEEQQHMHVWLGNMLACVQGTQHSCCCVHLPWCNSCCQPFFQRSWSPAHKHDDSNYVTRSNDVSYVLHGSNQY